MGDKQKVEADESEFYAQLISEMFAGGGGGTGPTRLGGGSMSKRWKLALVGKVIGMLEHLKQPSVPEKPASLPQSNLSLRMSLDACARKGERAPATDREIRDTFNRWRDEVVRLEGESAGRLGLLLFCVDVLVEQVESGEHGMESTLRMVSDHVCHMWPVDEPFPSGRNEREAWVLKACRRTDLIPNWLLSNLKPPLFIPGGGGGSSDAVASDDFLDE